MTEITPEMALKAVEDAYETERRCSHEVLHKTIEERSGRIVFRCQCGFVVEGKTGRPDFAEKGPEYKIGTGQIPSPIDGLTHSSVWGNLNDLKARVERLEKLVNMLSRED